MPDLDDRVSVDEWTLIANFGIRRADVVAADGRFVNPRSGAKS